MKKENQTRRDFIKTGGLAAAGLAGLPFLATACNAKPESTPAAAGAARTVKDANPKVVVAKDASVWNGKTLDAANVKKLLFKAVRELSGKATDTEAWAKYYGPADVVGVKINCIAGRRLSTTPETVAAIVDGLLLAGVKKSNIIVWDRTSDELTKAGFTVSADPSGVRYIGTDDDGYDYDSELTASGEVTTRVSRIASTICNTLLNASVLKEHGLTGVSCAMKNFFGAINNPNKLHSNGCNPMVADNFAIPAFSEKTRLHICDGTLAQYQGGPAYSPSFAWEYGGFLVAEDAVALDAVALTIIDAKRKEMGLKSVKNEGKPAKYIASASKRNLGVADLTKINTQTVTL